MMIHPMIHPGLASLNGQWDKNEYAAGYRACFAAIPDFDGAHHCWRVGWEDATRKSVNWRATRRLSERAQKTTIYRRGASYLMLAAMRG